ncbi:MAG: hypothetical protein JWO82_3450 [Akkermansiaceae bacterium]|nr:hypothetical protein [Akkermansiaceae bacterium]
MNLETIFLSLLNGDHPDFGEVRLSARFENLASWLFPTVRPGCWYDGVAELRHRRRKEKQIVFNGRMWVCRGGNQWQEDFEAHLTDMRLTRQGIRVKMWIGNFCAEGSLQELRHPPQ